MQVEARRGVCGCATPGTIAEGGEEDVSGTAIGTVLSTGIVDVFSDEVVNAADLGADAAAATWAQPDPPERAIGRCWLAVAAAALVTGASI
jgi:autotransporter passenger strand-loop-strand repeat protein